MPGGPKLVALGVVAILFGALFAPTVVGAQEREEERIDTVTVEAKREVDIEPDIGTVSLGVRVHALTADRATERLTNRTRRVISAIEGAGFTDEELETYGVELQRVCLDRCRDPNPRDRHIPEPVLGYRGSAGVRVETAQLNRLGEVIDAGIGAGANAIRGISFDVEDKSEAVKEALRQAMQLATDKARILAETGGRQLGPAIVITEGNTRSPVAYDVAPRALATTAGSASTGGGDQSNPFPIEPPTLSASARVTATFELL